MTAALTAPVIDDWRAPLGGAQFTPAPGSLFGIDFSTGKSWPLPPSSLYTFSRASAGYADDKAGNWTLFSSGQPRTTNKGLRYEPSRTNSLRTSNPVEAVPLTYGAEATDYTELLTNWKFTSSLSGWTVTQSGGSSAVWASAQRVTFTYDGTNALRIDQSFTTVVGHRYTVRVAVGSITSGTWRFSIGKTNGGTDYLSAKALIAGPQYISFIAASTTTWVRVNASGASAGLMSLYSVSAMLGGPPSLSGTTQTWTLSDGYAANLEVYQYISAVGTENGLPYVTWRVTGTVAASGSSYPQFYFERPNQIAASSGQTWASQFFYRLSGGSLTGVFSTGMEIAGTNGSAVQESDTQLFTPTTSLQNFTMSLALANGATTNVFSLSTMSLLNGATVDVSIDIAIPQLELGASSTSPYPATTAAATRSADLLTLNNTGIGRVVFTFDDGSQQTVSGIDTGTQYSFPTTLNRRVIKRADGYAS